MANKEPKYILTENADIEEKIILLQRKPSPEALAVALTAVRRQMKRGGQLVVAVDASMQLQTVEVEGKPWIPAFTSFDEEMKGDARVMSTFTADMRKLFELALASSDAEGIVLNPWNKTLMLSRHLIEIVLGK